MKSTLLITFASLTLTTSVFVFEACSSSSSSGSEPGDQDAGTSDGSPGNTGPQTCGPPPYITLGLVVEAASHDPNPARVQGATLTSPLCPDASFASDNDGGIVGLVSKDAAFYGRFSANGYTDTISPEEKFEMDSPGVTIPLPPSLATIIVPGYDVNKPTIFLDALADTGTNHDGGANCTDVSGVSFSVDGHPEAQVTYYSADTVPAPVNGATATTTGGQASIVGLDASASPVTITATKAGCTVSFIKDAATGRIPLENGYFSIAGAYLRD